MQASLRATQNPSRYFNIAPAWPLLSKHSSFQVQNKIFTFGNTIYVCKMSVIYRKNKKEIRQYYLTVFLQKHYLNTNFK